MAGYCSADHSHVYINAPKGKTEFPAFWALLQHPILGNIVFDTGYAERFLEATNHFPNSLYRMIVPVTYKAGDDVKTQLKTRFNIDNQTIKYVIISHFHGDHVGGLRDFPNAKIICSKIAFEHIWQHNDFFAFTKAYLKALLPDDLPSRCLFIEDNFPLVKSDFFEKTWFWEAANLTFIDLPGHARGQIGVILQSESGSETGEILLAADAAWHIHSVENDVPPPSLVRVFADDYEALKNSISRLHRYHKANPNTKIIISHCLKSLKKYF